MRVSRRSNIAAFQVMDVFAAAHALERGGRDIFHLEAGEPGGPTPQAVREAAARALTDERIGYTEPLGAPALRKRIAEHYAERYGIDLAPSRVIVTAGASAGFILAFLGAFDLGARVGVTLPGYPAYTNILRVLGLQPVEIATTRADRFQPTPDLLAGTPGLTGLVLQSPANPTGTMLGSAQLGALCAMARARDCVVVSDEIYHGITFGEPAQTALAFDDDAIVINSFSKYFCMTGWRIGWMVVPEVLVRPLERIAQNLFISPSSISQYAALGAFDARPELEARVAAYRDNRDRLLAALTRAELGQILVPDGGFYIYCDVAHLTDDSERFCKMLLTEAGVAATPGTDFDPQAGRTTLRLSFAGPSAMITRAADAFEHWLKHRT